MLRLWQALTRHSWWIAYLWLAVGLILAAQFTVGIVAAGQQVRLIGLLAASIAGWLDIVLATPLLLWLARRFPLAKTMDRRNLSVHVATAIGLGAIHVVWYAVLQWALNPFGAQTPVPFRRALFLSVMIQFHTGIIVYATIVAVRTTLDSTRRLAQREAELAKAQFAALRRQLEPHFLFNTLNGIAGLVRENKNEAAVSMIAGLGDLLRRVLEDSDRQLVPLAEEISFLERYVDLQSMRLGDRLKVVVDIPLELSAALVPQLLLQPLVENAIVHGVAKLVDGGQIRVTGREAEGILSLHVYNDGPCVSVTETSDKPGVGLSNTRERLVTLCGAESSVELRTGAQPGVETIIRLPYRTAA